MQQPARYLLTMYDGHRKVGQMSSAHRSTLEHHQQRWNQASDDHSSTIEEQILQHERIDAIPTEQYLTQSL